MPVVLRKSLFWAFLSSTIVVMTSMILARVAFNYFPDMIVDDLPFWDEALWFVVQFAWMMSIGHPMIMFGVAYDSSNPTPGELRYRVYFKSYIVFMTIFVSSYIYLMSIAYPNLYAYLQAYWSGSWAIDYN